MKYFITLILKLILIIISLIFEGYVFTYLWNNFIFNIFNVSQITTYRAIGFLLLYQLITYKGVNTDTNNKYSYLQIYFGKIATVGLILLIANLITLFL